MSTALIYGCMALGGSWDDRPLDAPTVDRARVAVRAALDAGMTEFDHADIYANGKSEQVFGLLLAEDPALRARITLQTKCGVRLPGNTAAPHAPAHYRLDRDTIRRSLEGSLQRLGVDSVDRLLLHRPDPLADPREVASALDELCSEGLVRSLGLSNTSLPQVRLYQQLLATPIAALQMELSLRRRGFVEQQLGVDHEEGAAGSFPAGLLEHCMARGIELQAWGALARGLYTGGRIPAGDARTAATAALVARLARDHAVPSEAVVLAWLLKHPARIRPVIGTTNPDRIAACAQAEGLASRLSHEDWYGLLAAVRGRDVP